MDVVDKIKIKVLGRVSKSLRLKFKDVLGILNRSEKEIVLFVDFSESDVSIGHVFTKIEDVETNILYHGNIVLKSVSQENFLPFDMIPKGHKTICKFEIQDRSVFNFIGKLPEIENWYKSNNSLLFY